jgi:hypothetical protein
VEREVNVANQALDFKSFKKVQENDKIATMQHHKGHQVQIVKASLSPHLRDQLAQLPLHQAEGSKEPVEEPSFGPGEESATDRATEQVMTHIPQAVVPWGGGPDKKGKYTLFNPQDQSPPDAPNQLVKPSSSTGILSALKQEPPPPAPPTPEEIAKQQQQQMDEAINAAPGGATTMKALGEAAQGKKDYAGKVITATENQSQDLAKGAAKILADNTAMNNEHNLIVKEMRGKVIRPDAYFSDMKAPQKIATAIGLILGGIGGGQTGQENPALKFVMKQIDNNLEGQKANMANRHNLLSALQHQYGNNIVAENMYRSVIAAKTASDLQGAAAVNMSKQAEAERLNGVAALEQYAAQTKQRAQLYNAVGQLQSPGPWTPERDAHAQVLRNELMKSPDPAMQKVAKDIDEHYIPSVGWAQEALSPKDKDVLRTKSDLDSQLKEVKEYLASNPGVGAGLFGANRGKGKALSEHFLTSLSKFAELNRLSEVELKHFEKMVPDLTGTHFTGQDQAKFEVLQQALDHSINNFYKQKGIHREAGDTERVPVIGPDGKAVSVPRSQLELAQKQGYKPVQ